MYAGIYKPGTPDSDLTNEELRERLIDLRASTTLPLYLFAGAFAVYILATAEPWPRWTTPVILVAMAVLRAFQLWCIRKANGGLPREDVQLRLNNARAAVRDAADMP